MAERWRGIFTILLTPFHEDRSLDEESLRREVDFVIAAGAHGIVTPVNTSEFFLLADDERRRLAEIVVEQARGRVPVVDRHGRPGHRHRRSADPPRSGYWRRRRHRDAAVRRPARP